MSPVLNIFGNSRRTLQKFPVSVSGNRADTSRRTEKLADMMVTGAFRDSAKEFKKEL
jgi:hypothetical protein